MEENRNYGWFYGLLRELPFDGDRDELKRRLVKQYTFGRTASVREMTAGEYGSLCRALEREVGRCERRKVADALLRKRRSMCLKLMQELGVDTTSWCRVDAFCEDVRIAGKRFARLSDDELVALGRKLRTIKRKGGLGRKTEAPGTLLDVSGLEKMLMSVGEA